MRDLARVLSYRFGHNPRRYVSGTLHLLRPPDFSDELWSIIRLIQHYTMTSPERVSALVESIQFIVQNRIPGNIVECGVWRGGSMMAVALALRKSGDALRELHLFDTFEGMPKPNEEDIDLKGNSADTFFRKRQTGPDRSDFCRATLDPGASPEALPRQDPRAWSFPALRYVRLMAVFRCFNRRAVACRLGKPRLSWIPAGRPRSFLQADSGCRC